MTDTMTEASTTTSWPFKSSRGTDTYTVTLVSRRPLRLSCTCPGFYYRKECCHVQDVQKQFPAEANDGRFLRAALAYAKMGFHVIPVEPNGKRPLVLWKDYQTQKPLETQIRGWWAKTPNANVGLVLGAGRVVIDLDGGPEAEALLAAAGIELPQDAPRVRTRSGFHVYLKAATPQPDRIGLLKAEQPLAEKSLTPKGQQRHAQIDVRGLGIIIAPPSVHASGHVYEWVTPLVPRLPDAPEALLALINRPEPPKVPVCEKCGAKVGWQQPLVDGKRVRRYNKFCSAACQGDDGPAVLR